MNLFELSAAELSAKVKSKELSAQEIAMVFLERAKTLNPRVKAFIEIDEKGALETAEKIDKQISAGQPAGSLAGVPIAIKDNICITGWHTTCASKILKNYTSTYDATVIRKLRESGAVLIGRTNMDEFAMGSSTENSSLFTTKDPWNLECVPGGSSGGSAAAVSARMSALSIGSDTGGSIRQPAGFCGVLGLKPTYGRVSRFGLIAFASSLDQIGPFANTAEDCALALQTLSGSDEKDSTSADAPVPDYAGKLSEPLGKLKIGLPKEYFVSGLDKSVRDQVMNAVKIFEGLGAVTEEVSLPNMDYATAVYYILAPSEASANLARFDGVRYGHRSSQATALAETYEKSRGEGFGPEVKRRIMLGTYALLSGYYDAYYAKAQKVRTLICRDFENAFKKVDVLITPTSPTPPFKIGQKVSDPLQMYLSDIFTISCNLAGVPGMSVPCGFDNSGMSAGFQILGRPFDELTMLKMSRAYQQKTGWHKKLPPL